MQANMVHTSSSSNKQGSPEISLRGIILALILVVLLAASNAFLGLKVGMTVAASIPAAVISMGVLRFFKNSNVLENNIVQTLASAGEALVGGTIFIVPAFVLLGYWHTFPYFETVSIAAVGGVLGVLFSIPLRRVLLNHKSLKFPEGTAIGHVLNAGAGQNKQDLNKIVQGGLVGGLISFAQSGLKVLSEGFNSWFSIGNHTIFGLALGFNPALLAAGYIVGIQVALAILLGAIICWLVAIPLLTTHYVGNLTVMADIAMKIWQEQVRYIGVGVMLGSGFWTLLTLAKPLAVSLKASFVSMKQAEKMNLKIIPNTERDIPINYVLLATLLLMIPVFFIVGHYVSQQHLGITNHYYWFVITMMTLFVLIAGFVFSSLCGYFSGLVGATNSPISSLALGAIMSASLLALVLLENYTGLKLNAEQSAAAAVMVIATCAIVACAAAISNDNIQDLKAGQLVGATPWKQQLMLILGVLVAATVVPLVLRLLFQAYGIGDVFPRPGMDPMQALSAPQATAMSFVVKAAFLHQLPWGLLGTGGLIAMACLLLNAYLSRYNFTLPALAVGMGIYLSFQTMAPLIIGGILSFVLEKIAKKRHRITRQDEIEETVAYQAYHRSRHSGLVLACGIVAGSTMMGVILAVPFALAKSTEVLRIVSTSFMSTSNILSLLVLLSIVVWFYGITCLNIKN